jgi:hypothetical protein
MPGTSDDPEFAADESEGVFHLQNDFSDLELLRTGLFTAAVPFDAPLGAKRRVIAALTSYVWGNKSIDYTLKRYSDLWKAERPSEEEQAIFAALADAKQYVKAFKAVILAFPQEDVPSGLVTAEACFVRLEASFQCASFLVRAGYHFEAATVCRLILEQFAWAMAIYDRDDDGIFQLQPNSCIASPKALHPGAGQLYGELSRLAHLHPDHQPEYIRLEDGRLRVLDKLPQARWTLVFILLNLADWYRTCGEFMTFKYVTEPQAIVRGSDGRLQPSPDRPFLSLIALHACKANSLGVAVEVDD